MVEGSNEQVLSAVLRIRIRILMINMFLGLPDPDPLVRNTDPVPESGSFYHQAKKIVRKTLILLFYDFIMTFYLGKIM
jgi:hypothetical protein